MKKYIILGLSALFLSLTVTAASYANVSLRDKVAEIAGIKVAEKLLGEIEQETVVEEVVMEEGVTDMPDFVAGATPGADRFNPVECYQGICHAFVKQSLGATSTSFCILQNPLKSTSTILNFTMGISGRGGQIAAHTFDVSTTTVLGAYGSSSPALIYARSLAANISDSVVWTPQFASTSENGRLFVLGENLGTFNGSNPFLIAPAAYITARWATATPAVMASGVSGVCSAVFQEIKGI